MFGGCSVGVRHNFKAGFANAGPVLNFHILILQIESISFGKFLSILEAGFADVLDIRWRIMSRKYDEIWRMGGFYKARWFSAIIRSSGAVICIQNEASTAFIFTTSFIARIV